MAILTAGRIGDKSAVEQLVTCLSDAHSEVRGEAAQALGLIGDNSAVFPLARLLRDTKPHIEYEGTDDDGDYYHYVEARVCDSAIEALKRIGTLDALEIVGEWQREQTSNMGDIPF